MFINEGLGGLEFFMIEDIGKKRMSDQDCDHFKQLYMRFGQVVFNVANKILRDPMGAEDVVHDVFLKVFDRPEAFELIPEKHYYNLHFLVLITKQVAYDRIKKEKRVTLLEDLYYDETSFKEEVHQGIEDRDELDSLLDQIPSMYGEAVTLKYLHDLSYKDLARTLKISESNARKRVSRGMAILRQVAFKMET